MSLLPTLDVLRKRLPNTCHLRWSAQGGSVIILPGVTIGEVLLLLNRLLDICILQTLTPSVMACT